MYRYGPRGSGFAMWSSPFADRSLGIQARSARVWPITMLATGQMARTCNETDAQRAAFECLHLGLNAWATKIFSKPVQSQRGKFVHATT
jgi:hypothetical protein